MEFVNTFWALVPPIVAIVLALITKETYSSLFIGILVGALFVSGFSPVGTLDAMITEGFTPAISDNAGIFMFLVILGIMVALVNSTGAAAAFGHFGFPAGQIIGDVHQQSGRHRIGQQIHVGHHLCRSQQIIAQRLARQRGRLGRIMRTRQAPRRLHHAAVGFGQVGNIPVEPGKSIAGFNRRGGRIVGGNHKGITAANK